MDSSIPILNQLLSKIKISRNVSIPILFAHLDVRVRSSIKMSPSIFDGSISILDS